MIPTIYIIGAVAWFIFYIWSYRRALEFATNQVLSEAALSATIWFICLLYCAVWVIGIWVKRWKERWR